VATLTLASGFVGYRHLVAHVLKNGEPRRPRGLPTRDVGLTTVELVSPRNTLPLNQGRRLNPAIAAVEAIQLVGAFSRPALMVKVSDNFTQFMNRERGVFHGAYGMRVGDQVACAIRKIREDVHTRQAVVTLWDPWLDNLPNEKDYPCTVGFNLQVNPVTSELEMNVIMRSSDVWLGIPYDLFQFTQLQLTVAGALQLAPGRFTLTTWSLHIYERDVPGALKLHAPTDPVSPFQPTGVGRLADPWSVRKSRAFKIGNERGVIERPTESEEWYRETLAPYLG